MCTTNLPLIPTPMAPARSSGALTPLLLSLLLAMLQPAAGADNTAAATTSFRLDRSVLPSHYDLYIETYLGDGDDGFRFKGHVVITLAVTLPVQEIRLHTKALEVPQEAIQLTQEEGVAPAVRGMLRDSTRDFLVISLDHKLSPGITYRLRLNFSAPLGKGLAGYYRSSYRDQASGQTRWLAVTQFESTDARRAFPCFDEPSFKATFTITLAHHSKYTAISNMPLNSSQPMEGQLNWLVDRFERSLPMSTYLVAFLVSDLQHMDSATADNSTLFRVWARREALQQTEFATDVGPRILDFYTHFFQVPYPLPKQDMVAIPDFSAGAMENWGLITYRERLLLFDSQQSSLQAKHGVASVVAHELAHQWFGNLVTMHWWSDLWLNEGFATYVSTLGVNAVQPHWAALEADALTNLLTVLSFDAVETSHPLFVNLTDPSEISQIFDAISYKKGAFLIRMMSLFLGEEVFRAGLTNYLREHGMRNAEQDDLWAALSQEAHRVGALPANTSVKEIMDTWTLQAGYPLLTVSRDYKAGSLTVSQRKYHAYQAGDTRGSARSFCWEVPLTFTTQKRPREAATAWMHCGQGQPALHLQLDAGPSDWLMVNVNATGLVRVLYDDRGWELLTESLNGDPTRWGLDPLSRAVLVQDALSLAWSGDLSYDRTLALVSYLHKEHHHLPWVAALSGFSSIHRLLQRTSNSHVFQKYLMGLLEEPFLRWQDLSHPPPADDLESYRQRRLLVSWACQLHVPACVDQAVKLFADWMKRGDPDRVNPLPRGLRYELTCTALREGGDLQWEFAWQRYLSSNVASESTDLLRALGCARDTKLLQRLLEWSIQETKGIRRQDSWTIFSSVASSEYGFDVAKEFLFENITQLYQFYGPRPDRIAKYVEPVAGYLYTEQDLQEFDEFTQKNRERLQHASLAVRQSRDKISVNMAWHHVHYAHVVRQLEQRTG